MNISTCILTHSVQITPSKTGIHGPGTADSRFRLSKVLKLDMDVKSWPVIPHKRPYKWNETIWRCNSCALHAETCCQTRNQSPNGGELDISIPFDIFRKQTMWRPYLLLLENVILIHSKISHQNLVDYSQIFMRNLVWNQSDVWHDLLSKYTKVDQSILPPWTRALVVRNQ